MSIMTTFRRMMSMVSTMTTTTTTVIVLLLLLLLLGTTMAAEDQNNKAGDEALFRQYVLSEANSKGRPIKLGMVSGSWDSEFFQQVQVGWDSGCRLAKQRHHEWLFGSSGGDSSGESGEVDTDDDVMDELFLECIYSPTNWTFYANEVEPGLYYTHSCTYQMDEMVDNDNPDAMAAACIYDLERQDVMPSWTKASDDGRRPLVTFDGPPPDDFPFPIASYVGTDNYFLGQSLARLLKQLRPEGGAYGLLYHNDHVDRSRGFRTEILKDNGREDKAQWYEIQDRYGFQDPLNSTLDRTRFQMHLVMEDLALQEPTAIVFMYQTPMRAENYTKYIDEYTRPRNVTVIGTDGSDYQLNYLSRRYVDGLVGQLPFDMGQFAARELYELALDRRRTEFHNQQQQQMEDGSTTTNTTTTNNETHPTTHAHLSFDQYTNQESGVEIIPTNLVAYNLIPLELPPLDVDQSLLGNLVYTGYVCFAVVAICSLGAIAWTVINRQKTVVRASQPAFLCMTATGVLLMSSALIPLSFDDNGEPKQMSQSYATGICMSIPWLAFTGFTVTFSALFSKTWRINRVFKSAETFGRTQVTVRDVMLPFVVLLSLNFLVLILWTAIDPLRYEREFLRGTDYWNREYESVGTCQSEYAVAFLVPLACINFFVLVIASWQAWNARSIEEEFSESKYIALAIFSFLQAFLTGIPIVAIVRDIPEAFYLVTTFLIFILSMVLLFLIFLPKILIQHQYDKMPLSAQRKQLKQSVRQSSLGQGSGGSSDRFGQATSSMMAAARMAQERYDAENKHGPRSPQKIMAQSNASSADSSTFVPSNPYGSGPFQRDGNNPTSDEFLASSVTASGTTFASSSASFITNLLTRSELEAILAVNSTVQEQSPSNDTAPLSSNSSFDTDVLATRVVSLLVERSRQKHAAIVAPIGSMQDMSSSRNNNSSINNNSTSISNYLTTDHRPSTVHETDEKTSTTVESTNASAEPSSSATATATTTSDQQQQQEERIPSGSITSRAQALSTATEDTTDETVTGSVGLRPQSLVESVTEEKDNDTSVVEA